MVKLTKEDKFTYNEMMFWLMMLRRCFCNALYQVILQHKLFVRTSILSIVTPRIIAGLTFGWSCCCSVLIFREVFFWFLRWLPLIMFESAAFVALVRKYWLWCLDVYIELMVSSSLMVLVYVLSCKFWDLLCNSQHVQ